MTEPSAAPPGGDPSPAPAGAGADDGTAGALLRAARTRQGMHIAVLAASMKVPQSKLEALEAGRYEELTDATFTRALALSVCRVLKTDAAPVLARLPGARASALEKVDGGLNTPFRDRPGRIDPADWALSRKSVVLVVVVLLVAAAALWLQPVRVPLRFSEPQPAASAPGATSSAASDAREPVTAPVAAPIASVETAAPGASAAVDSPQLAMPAPAALPASSSAPAASGETLNVRAIQDTWMQVSDRQGRTLLSRQLAAGEVVDLNGEPPFKLRIGNVRGTEIRLRGAAVDLASATRANVATLMLP